jgi:hypothetical protein
MLQHSRLFHHPYFAGKCLRKGSFIMKRKEVIFSRQFALHLKKTGHLVSGWLWVVLANPLVSELLILGFKKANLC